MWQSWVEVNPKVAAKLGVGHGDVVKVSSNVGSVEVPVYIFPGIGEDMVAMPLGQGHRDYGRYARDRGVNPADLLVPALAGDSGELAFGATRVSLEKTGRKQPLPRLEGSDAMGVPAEL
jgi:anaerobic selenocysteine-containing dehydrogenase